MSLPNTGVSVAVDSKAYELALFYLGTYRLKQLDSMTADEVAEITRKLALEIRGCVTKFLEKESCVRGGFEGEFAFY